MFVAYLDHAPPGIRIQYRNCWYLGVETETSKEMVSGISGERGGGESLHGLSEVKYKSVSRVTLPRLPVRVSRPCVEITGAVRISPCGVVAYTGHNTVNIRRGYVNECHCK